MSKFVLECLFNIFLFHRRKKSRRSNQAVIHPVIAPLMLHQLRLLLPRDQELPQMFPPRATTLVKPRRQAKRLLFHKRKRRFRTLLLLMTQIALAKRSQLQRKLIRKLLRKPQSRKSQAQIAQANPRSQLQRKLPRKPPKKSQAQIAQANPRSQLQRKLPRKLPKKIQAQTVIQANPKSQLRKLQERTQKFLPRRILLIQIQTVMKNQSPRKPQERTQLLLMSLQSVMSMTANSSFSLKVSLSIPPKSPLELSSSHMVL
jgi:hypothetical protein